jgi:predicted nicotinamide N-methyase
MKCSTRLVRLEEDLDEDEDNFISITEVDGDDRFGTASKIWEAGLILAKYIHRNEKSFRGEKVPKLGSGTGVLGLYLAAIGFDVVLSDLEPVCTTILKMNSEEPRNVAMMNESGGKAQIRVIACAMPKEKLRECFEEFLVKENIGLIVSSDPIYNTINM